MLINKINIGSNIISNGYLNIPLSSNFSTSTQHYEGIEKNFDVYNNNNVINKIIDYEKVRVYPSGASLEADSLNFKLHFLNNNIWDSNATKISDIGFNSDDVLNKRKKLEKTFIRLSFFDSNDLKIKNLLYYSTIFIDTDFLYSKLISDGTIDNLKTEFLVPNPKLSNKIKSFEGFNLYLFKEDILKNKTKTIYLRVDFSNASNGKTTLFTRGNPQDIGANSGYTMQQLYDNLFYEIECSYDNSAKKYIYRFVGKDIYVYPNIEDKNIKNTINIDLYQAKVI